MLLFSIESLYTCLLFNISFNIAYVFSVGDISRQNECGRAVESLHEGLTHTEYKEQTRNTVILEDDNKAESVNPVWETQVCTIEKPHGFLDLLQEAIEQREKEHAERNIQVLADVQTKTEPRIVPSIPVSTIRAQKMKEKRLQKWLERIHSRLSLTFRLTIYRGPKSQRESRTAP